MTDISSAPYRGFALEPFVAARNTKEAAYILFLKRGLNRLGYYMPDKQTGMTPEIDPNFQDALHAFQRHATIFFDDMDIGPGSTTERILKRDLAALGDNGHYIWRTVGDDKVRGDHAAREGQNFSWDRPPEGGNPGEDYNCRCWAEPINPAYHPWKEWARERREAREVLQTSSIEPDPVLTEPGRDAINPTWSPFDFIAPGGSIVKGVAGAGAKTVGRAAGTVLARTRDVGWIRNASRSQLQKKFKHAEIFGIKGNPNNKTIKAYKKALEDHVRSSDTLVKKGILHKETVTHYYNPKNRINVMKSSSGDFKSAWKLTDDQVKHIESSGKLGGGKK